MALCEAGKRGDSYTGTYCTLMYSSMQAVQNGESIHSDTLKQKAQELADEMEIPRKNFAASSGWLARFKHRKGFVKKKDGMTAQPQTLQPQEAMHIGLPPGYAELPAQAASFQAQLMEANVAPSGELAGGVRLMTNVK